MLGKKGFTLIELLVVIIIVGILAAISVPMMSSNVQRARGTEGYAAVGAIRTAERLYFVENDEYTDTIADLGLTLDGQFYNSDNLDLCAVGTGDAATFTANIGGLGAAAGEWVFIDQDGDTDDSF